MVRIYVIRERCKGCGHKFGFDPDAHTQLEYLCSNQPKWMIKIGGKKYYYCSDRCVSKDFKRVKKTRHEYYTPLWSYFILIGFLGYKKHFEISYPEWVYYKKIPKKKFRVRLTKCYKLLRKNQLL